MQTDARELLQTLFAAAVKSADPAHCVAPNLPSPPSGRTIVVGAGKAAAAMARAFEVAWAGPCEGVVVTRYGHTVPTDQIRVIEAAHPVPDAAGEDAARQVMAAVTGLTSDDLVVCLMSGGASALLTMPAGDLTLDDKQAVNRALLKSGATIGEMNCVRKHLSAIKGGQLAKAAMPARVVTLAISDVPGDGPEVIGSGPTVPDPTTRTDALALLDAYKIEPPPRVRAWLDTPASETPKVGDQAFATSEFHLIATPQAALEAAAAVARQHGVTPVIIGDAIEGEAREVAIVHAGIARQIARHGQPAAPPAVLLSGGETTVTVRGTGRGGRNAEFLLALAVALGGDPRIAAIACDTDGIDGTEDNAGAVVLPDTIARATAAGLDLSSRLSDNDGYGVFQALGDLVMTGPTLTNVNDFRAILVLDPGRTE
ncbi:MAG: glycerate kinase [Pseudomonadota bacterium]